MARVPREQFVAKQQAADAYRDGALPIGHGQTISQPFIVALMTELAATRPDSVVLEVGTGSGYQAAVLAGLVRQVYTLEIIEDLAREAGRRLDRLGYRNVEVRRGDGRTGWAEHAPYDAIVVTAVATRTPAPLVEQLAVGGRLVIPLGDSPWDQRLVVIEKDTAGSVRHRDVLPVRFVPLTRERAS